MTKRKRRLAVENLDTHSSESDTDNDLEDEYDTPSESDQGSDTSSETMKNTRTPWLLVLRYDKIRIVHRSKRPNTDCE